MGWNRRLLALIPLITIATFTAAAPNSAVTGEVDPEFIIGVPVVSQDMGIIPIAINSPYNGEAEIHMSNTFWWKFGALLTATKETGYTLSMTLRNGASTALIQAWRVTVYSVACIWVGWLSRKSACPSHTSTSTSMRAT